MNSALEEPGTEHAHMRLGQEYDRSHLPKDKDQHLSYSVSRAAAEQKHTFWQSLRGLPEDTPARRCIDFHMPGGPLSLSS